LILTRIARRKIWYPLFPLFPPVFPLRPDVKDSSRLPSFPNRVPAARYDFPPPSRGDLTWTSPPIRSPFVSPGRSNVSLGDVLSILKPDFFRSLASGRTRRFRCGDHWRPLSVPPNTWTSCSNLLLPPPLSRTCCLRFLPVEVFHFLSFESCGPAPAASSPKDLI